MQSPEKKKTGIGNINEHRAAVDKNEDIIENSGSQETSIDKTGDESLDNPSANSIEERPFWGEFTGGEIDEVGEYKEPTPEQREKFEKRVERVAEIFKGADFQWYLDGATNISLYGDNQIRDHKDLDLSIFKEDALKLEGLLAGQGFGIFTNYEENGKRLMRPVKSEELSGADKLHLSICKIGSNGKIEINTPKGESPEAFNFVDLHVHSKDAEGNTVINYTGTALPKEFFEPYRKMLPNGEEINLSQPAIVAYHKLHADRSYDVTDLYKLRPNLQEKDYSMLREALTKEMNETENKVREKLREVWESLTPLLELTRDQTIISEKLWEHPDLQTRRKDQRTSEYVLSITKYMSENQNVSFDDFLTQSLALLKIRKSTEQKLQLIDQLEKGQK